MNSPVSSERPFRKLIKCLGEVISKNPQYVVVRLEGYGGSFHCQWRNITDFPERQDEILEKVNFIFLIDQLDPSLFISYKRLHPQEVRHKKRTIPTCSHYQTLRRIIARVNSEEFAAFAEQTKTPSTFKEMMFK